MIGNPGSVHPLDLRLNLFGNTSHYLSGWACEQASMDGLKGLTMVRINHRASLELKGKRLRGKLRRTGIKEYHDRR
jgi:hypothetical protein